MIHNAKHCKLSIIDIRITAILITIFLIIFQNISKNLRFRFKFRASRMRTSLIGASLLTKPRMRAWLPRVVTCRAGRARHSEIPGGFRQRSVPATVVATEAERQVVGGYESGGDDMLKLPV